MSTLKELEVAKAELQDLNDARERSGGRDADRYRAEIEAARRRVEAIERKLRDSGHHSPRQG